MHAVRKRILEILKETGGATVAELAAALDMAPVSVRHHLDILQGDDLICVDRLERKGSVGRPQQVYGLTEEANAYFPNDFAALAEHLVRQLKSILPPDQVQQAFQGMACEIAHELDADLDALPLEDRLEHITEFLNTRGYLARWEAESDGTYLLHKHNCPYAGVSSDHNELCLMDKALVEQLTSQSCDKVSSMADNALCCTYRIGLEANGAALDSEAEDRAAKTSILPDGLIPVDQIELTASAA